MWPLKYLLAIFRYLWGFSYVVTPGKNKSLISNDEQPSDSDSEDHTTTTSESVVTSHVVPPPTSTLTTHIAPSQSTVTLGTAKTPMDDPRVSWIYILGKDELRIEMGKYGLDTTGKFEVLRRRFVDFWKNPMGASNIREPCESNTNITSFIIWMWTQALQKGYDWICFWAGPVPLIIVVNPSDIKKLLNSSNSLTKGNEMESYLKTFVDEGLLTAPVEQWKTTRRNMNPLFHPRNIENLIPVFNSNSRELVTNLSEHVGKGPINVMHPIMDLGLKTVCQMIFGTDMEFDIKSNEFKGLMEVILWLPEVFITRIVKLWLRNDYIFNFLYRKELQKMELAWRKFTEIPLKKAKEKYMLEKKKKELIEDNDDYENNKHEEQIPMTAVSIYSSMQENLPFITEKSLREEMMTLYLTGTDTMGNAVGSCLLAMAQYQDIQEKVYSEITTAVGLDGDVTVEDLKNFPYMEKVLKETLRFFTVVPFVSRRSTEEYKLGSCTVPADTTIFMCIAGLHMDPKTYPEPHKFDPERFSPENTATLDRYAYIPFSGGPRNCIGKTYSYTLMKIMLVHILRKYKVTTTMDIHNLKKKYCVTMVNSQGYNVSFENRN